MGEGVSGRGREGGREGGRVRGLTATVYGSHVKHMVHVLRRRECVLLSQVSRPSLSPHLPHE